ncbi:MAG: hypothetical protein JWP91_4119 [Fibrobacteres bacterium]|nr:hypothetical protein [Fibrobacterota bacterium]
MDESNDKPGAIAGFLARTRKPVTWIYCSAILFPLAFAFVAAIIMTLRNQAHGGGNLANGLFASFYLVLMSLLAAMPRSVLPAMLVWLLISGIRPVYDENKATRYLGLLVLIGIAVFSHSKVYDRPFNYLWLSVAYLAVILPRLALPSLRDGLKRA